jgi:hypothetical protein
MRYLILALFLLTSCYQPIYGNKVGGTPTAQEARLNAIAIGNIADEQGQTLRNLLIDRMYGAGRPEKTDARLDITITQTIEDLGLQKDATTLRKRVTFTAVYTLVDAANKTVLSTQSRAFATYNYIDAQYGALVSKDSAHKRALHELADLITARLLVYYGEGDAGTHDDKK